MPRVTSTIITNVDKIFPTSKVIEFVIFDPLYMVNTGNNKLAFHVSPSLSGTVLSYAHAMNSYPGSGGSCSIMLTRNRGGSVVNMLTSGLSIDSLETGTHTSSLSYVINTGNASLATNDIIGVNVTGVHTNPASGLTVTVELAL